MGISDESVEGFGHFLLIVLNEMTGFDRTMRLFVRDDIVEGQQRPAILLCLLKFWTNRP